MYLTIIISVLTRFSWTQLSVNENAIDVPRG